MLEVTTVVFKQCTISIKRPDVCQETMDTRQVHGAKF